MLPPMSRNPQVAPGWPRTRRWPSSPSPARALVSRQPFGGLRLSGTGNKAGGPDYLRQFMDPVCITENTARRGFAPEVRDS
jgi:hypothetical protein